MNKITPPADDRARKDAALHRIIDIMVRLRDPETGCPWDAKQTFETIAPYTIEEAYETADAINRGNLDDIRDELGDLLLQVIFQEGSPKKPDNLIWLISPTASLTR